MSQTNIDELIKEIHNDISIAKNQLDETEMIGMKDHSFLKD